MRGRTRTIGAALVAALAVALTTVGIAVGAHGGAHVKPAGHRGPLAALSAQDTGSPGDTDNVQQGDQTTPDAQSGEDTASESAADTESDATEPPAGQGHEDSGAGAGHECAGTCVE